MRRRRFLWLLAGLVVAGGLTAAFVPGGGMQALRSLTGGTAAEDTAILPLELGVVWSDDPGDGLFVEGAQLAVDDVNRRGGVLGRPLALRIAHEDPASRDRAASTRTARRLARRDDLMAVIGYQVDKSAVMASIVYEETGRVMINTGVTDDSVNKHSFDHVFSTIPDNEAIGVQVATFADGLGFRRIGILSIREDWAFQTADAFLQQAATLGLEIAARRSFFGRRDSFRDLIAEFGLSEFDAVLVLAPEETLPLIIRQTREMKLDVDFLIGAFVNAERLANAIRIDEDEMQQERVILPVLYNPEQRRFAVRRFARSFESRYERAPDGWAAQGYDAVRMLADVAQENRSTMARSVATTLRYALTWQGVTGRHSFDQRGRIYTKQVDFAIIANQTVSYIASAE